MVTLGRKDDNPVCAALRAAFPSYRKKSVFVSVDTTHEPFGYWHDGGSRSDYYEVQIANGCRARLAMPGGPPPYCKIADPITLQPGTMIVTVGTFCGKTATAHVYVHPDDAGELAEKAGTA